MPSQLSRIKPGLALLLLLALTAVSACGFHLRGAYSLPFTTLYIALPESTELHALIRRSIESRSTTKVVSLPASAEASLVILGDAQQKNILSLNAAGRVREFELVRTFSFRLSNAAASDIIGPSRIVMRREVTFNDEQVLSKEAEEVLLWRDMQNDLVQQLLRRLAAARPSVSATAPIVPPTPVPAPGRGY